MIILNINDKTDFVHGEENMTQQHAVYKRITVCKQTNKAKQKTTHTVD